MPQYILRTAPDRDEYVVWSTVVDTMVAGPGDRDAALAWMRNEWRLPDHEAAYRMRLAETDGSSSPHWIGAWGDEELVVMEGSPSDGWYHLPRGWLPEFAAALARDDEPAAQALLVCWQRFDEEGD